jgi:hypothetical protein
MAGMRNPYFWCKANTVNKNLTIQTRASDDDVSYFKLQETGKTFSPSLCGRYIEETGKSMTEEAEFSLVWAAAAVFGGGLDTVRRFGPKNGQI